MKRNTVWIWVVCLLLLAVSITGCSKSCSGQAGDPLTPVPASEAPQTNEGDTIIEDEITVVDPNNGTNNAPDNNAPIVTDAPVSTDASTETDAPATTDAPTVTAAPNNTQKPEETEDPLEIEIPINTPAPSSNTTQQPGQPSNPTATPEPEEPGEPSATPDDEPIELPELP